MCIVFVFASYASPDSLVQLVYLADTFLFFYKPVLCLTLMGRMASGSIIQPSWNRDKYEQYQSSYKRPAF